MRKLKEQIREFVVQSNAIEGLTRPAHELERDIQTHVDFLELPLIRVGELEKFVQAMTRSSRPMIRDKIGMNVRVGYYMPPKGGPQIPTLLHEILETVNTGHDNTATPGEFIEWETHLRYENLHPFLDGNGRSGRALWLWMRYQRQGEILLPAVGFLHLFYYHTLSYCKLRKNT